jgi:hypothetical protein
MPIRPGTGKKRQVPSPFTKHRHSEEGSPEIEKISIP